MLQSIVTFAWVVNLSLGGTGSHVGLYVPAGVFKVNCIPALHRQAHRLSWCHAVVGRASGYSPSGHKLFEKVCFFVCVF